MIKKNTDNNINLILLKKLDKKNLITERKSKLENFFINHMKSS